MESHLIPGTILNGRYRINKTIGQGGFGITYLAEHLELGIQVCIKELFISGMCSRQVGNTVHSHNVKDLSFEDFVERFVNEARELARFNHSGIVRVTDMFRENGTAYFVMDYVEGKTLKQLVAEKGPYPFEKARPLILQLLDAVETVHQRGMLHRDIKPDNILVTDDGSVVLIDFGSARSFGGDSKNTTILMLSPRYAAKEQYSAGVKKGPFTDIYSLGGTLYFMLTGQEPIPVVEREMNSMVDPHKINPAIHPTVSTAIMLALNIKPEDRFQQVDELRNAMDKLLNSGPHVEISELEVLTDSNKKNKRRKFIYAIIILTFIITSSYLIVLFFSIKGKNKSDLNVQSKFIVVDGHRAFKAGFNVWMAENLNVGQFRNGDPIPHAKTNEEWIQAGLKEQPAWCYYDNDPKNGVKYGKLYNWYAMADPRGLAPVGWHIASTNDWDLLLDSIGFREGLKMKDTADWYDGGNGTNEIGFTGLPGGNRDVNGNFLGIGQYGNWWRGIVGYRAKWKEGLAINVYLNYFDDKMVSNLSNVRRGLSVRCVKDR